MTFCEPPCTFGIPAAESSACVTESYIELREVCSYERSPV